MTSKLYDDAKHELSCVTPAIAFHYVKIGVWTEEKFTKYMEAVVTVVACSAATKAIDLCMSGMTEALSELIGE